LAEQIATSVIAKILTEQSGPAYEEAVRAGAAYWRLVLDGKDATAAKQEADEALSRLLGCTAQVSGRKLSWKEKIARAFS
jgi:hypothetical protein